MSAPFPTEIFIRGHKATDEQYEIIRKVTTSQAGSRFIIHAFAGSGKTSMLEGIASVFPVNSLILYIAFNASMAESARRIFANYRNVKIYTVHAFARPFILDRHENIREKNYTASEISAMFNIDRRDAYGVLKSFEYFCNSNLRDIGERVKNRELVSRLFEMMESGEIEKTHSFYLKMFQLNLLNSIPMNIPNFDCIMLDEYQDTNGVTQSIYDLLESPTKVAVGDNYQNVYGFRHSLNRMSDGKGEHLYLTKSFRFGDEIAGMANSILQTLRGEEKEIIGLGKNKTAKTAISLSRTNAYLINSISKLISKEKFYKTLRSADLLFSLPMNIASISEKGEIISKQFSYLLWDYERYKESGDNGDKGGTFDSFAEYIKELGSENNDPELYFAGDAAKKYGLSGLTKMLNRTRQNNNDSHTPCSYYLGTAHSAKGSEFDIVKIAGDFKDYFRMIGKHLATSGVSIRDGKYLDRFVERAKEGYVDSDILEEINLLYVAITRATVKVYFEDDTNLPINKGIEEINRMIGVHYTRYKE